MGVKGLINEKVKVGVVPNVAIYLTTMVSVESLYLVLLGLCNTNC